MPFLEKGKRGIGVDPGGRDDGFINIAVGGNDALTKKFWISERAALALGVLMTGLCCGGGLFIANLLVK